MGWITLNLDIITKQAQINDYELRLIGYSREKMRIHRHLSKDTSRLQHDKRNELKAAKETLDGLNDNKPESDDDSYQDWVTSYNEAKEEYDSKKTDISDNYDEQQTMLEEEATDEENYYDLLSTQDQTVLEVLRSELQTLKDQRSQDIKDTAIKLS